MKRDPRKILVFQTAFLGDACLAIPLLKSIKGRWPSCQLGLVCRKGVGELLLHGGVVDQIIEVDKTLKVSLKSAFRQTQEFKADIVISPHQSFRTALWIWRLRPAISVGFETKWNFFAFTKRVPRPLEKHDVLRQLSLMTPFGFELQSMSEEEQSLKLKIEKFSKFELPKKYGVLSPGSQWNTKRWTSEGFRSLGLSLEATGRGVVIVGTPSEQALCDTVAKSLSQAINLCGKTTVMELAQILKGADILFCNDSGTMHVASTVGTPTVSVFGPTVPSQGYAPWNKRSAIVQRDLQCRPCGAHGHDQCPIGTHECMKKVSAEEVWQKSLELM